MNMGTGRDRIRFLLVPIVTILSFVRFLATGEWPCAMIIMAGFAWIIYDGYVAYLGDKRAEMRAEANAKNEMRDKSDLNALQERITKIELALSFNRPKKQ